MKKFVDSLEVLQSIVAIFLFVALVVVVFLQVVSRYIFHNPLIWSEEVARFLLFWVALMGASLSVKTKRHFTIEFFSTEKIQNQTVKIIFRIIPHLCILIFALIMIFIGYQYCRMGKFRVGPSSNINMRYVYVAIPIAGTTMVLYSLYHILDCVKKWKSNK